jgi:DNA-binding HxlR family transcriptional regulator
METEMLIPEDRIHTPEACKASIGAVRDTLYVLNGKWKLPLIVAMQNGPLRFNDIQRSLGDITPKILSKELRDLELNEFVIRRVEATKPVTVTYELAEYSKSLNSVINELRNWGLQHKARITSSRRSAV